MFDVVNDHVFSWHANVPRAVLETRIMLVKMDKLEGVGIAYPSDCRMRVGAWNVSLESYSRIIAVNDGHPRRFTVGLSMCCPSTLKQQCYWSWWLLSEDRVVVDRRASVAARVPEGYGGRCELR